MSDQRVQLLRAFCIYVHGLMVFIFSTSLSQILRYREVLIAVLLEAVVYDIHSFSAPCILQLQGSEHGQCCGRPSFVRLSYPLVFYFYFYLIS